MGGVEMEVVKVVEVEVEVVERVEVVVFVM